MPQAGGSQREPSMEEILASIRRIIEDSDQGRKPEDTLSVSSATQDAEVPPMDLVAANAPTSGFDLPGQDRRTFETAAVGAQQPDEALAARPGPLDDVWADHSPSRHHSEPDAPAAETAAPGRLLDDAAAAEPAAMETAAEPVASEAMEPAAPDQPAAAPVEKASLISERTGRQVAAAFGELSEAFEASRRKSFDELATEMMRPMLQDWLDNNLPTLVEKLVREEIERVARGGR
ncbi:DUF2497 domain-containing protein [Aquibium carbonis]|uniref:DUF2497 domain-containing protein n=2 Tax=Aquibium carbonis TaxID=2495581 RepID=A0A3R9YAT2_9HYPH|nr:DUF2497 domain-containing protein [Aquibium carbonis]